MICQVAHRSIDLPCKAKESGGYRCERLDPHDDSGHWISDHTIAHALAGNGYSCSAIDPHPKAPKEFETC